MCKKTVNRADETKSHLSCASNEIISWLKQKRRTGVIASGLYSAAAILGGAIAMSLLFGLTFLVAESVILVSAPQTHAVIAWSLAIASVVVILICIDSRRTSRDDMSFMLLWLIREYFDIGPRAISDGFGQANRARRLARIDTETCAAVLAFLARKNGPASRAELTQALPTLDWPSLVAQLRLVDGVIVFRHDTSRVTLTLPLRLELRRLLKLNKAAGIPDPEPQPTPVSRPEAIGPCELLGVSDTATLMEIKAAYRHRVKECHPDRFAGMDEQSQQLAEEWTKALNSAYETLTAQRGHRQSQTEC